MTVGFRIGYLDDDQIRTGLGVDQVDNTPDTAKPVSTPQQTALDAKLDDSQAGVFGLSWLGTATLAAAKTLLSLVKGDVGLGSVDNTADAAKNVLSATKLTTARTINGVSFDGTANIVVPGSAISVVTKIAGYTETATSGEFVILADLAAGFTIVLPTAVGNTAKITVKKMQAAGSIVVDGSGTQTIDGGLTATLTSQYEAITIVSDNANWWII